ncbi:hypothetical protein L1049_026730 [Liquidambar formosana]|uniref:Uncharacterized protein n=1 Tax=Liquidambar formosana TaxID=63359 RepID=A0AAP0R923_LIQFO
MEARLQHLVTVFVIVEELAPPGASYRRGQTYARGRVGLAVPVATAFLRVLPGMKTSVPAYASMTTHGGRHKCP